jgi:hypothetical protein
MMERSDLGLRMQSWHRSMHDPIYAVGSYYFSGQRYPRKEIADAALESFKTLLDQNKRMLRGEKVSAMTFDGSTDDLRKFAGYKDEELNENITDLSEIVSALKEQIKKDYDGVQR